jgi:hypothetical protein
MTDEASYFDECGRTGAAERGQRRTAPMMATTIGIANGDSDHLFHQAGYSIHERGPRPAGNAGEASGSAPTYRIRVWYHLV